MLRGNRLVAGLAAPRGEAGIGEQPAQFEAERGGVTDDDGAAARGQLSRGLAEVVGVGTHEHGLASKRRLQHVVAAVRDETAADEHHVGDGVHLGQLAYGIDDDDVRLAPRVARVRSGVAASGAW